MTKWVVTTPIRAEDGTIQAATALAARLGAPLVSRGRKTLRSISVAAGGAAVLVADPRGQRARSPEGRIWSWHPGLAKIRIASIAHGTPDHLVRSVKPRPGMLVLDANLGLAHDALVMASQGALVTGLEVDPVIHIMTEAGLAEAPATTLPRAIREAAGRITPLLADQRRYLPDAKDDSFAAVLFSPMFLAPGFVADDMMPLREVAASSWPDRHLLQEALRVAPLVVVKTLRGGPYPLPDPGRWQHGGRSHVAYAVYER
ncbi:class I SAM-dependent methyltransferase [bacterium]|nr:class I SAM-dependent methyltransferase [bacterium]